MSLTASQARDVPAELTVDEVGAALQDLWQHLEHSQKDVVMCAQCTQKSCPAVGLLGKQGTNTRLGDSPCREVGPLQGQEGGSQPRLPVLPSCTLPSGLFLL